MRSFNGWLGGLAAVGLFLACSPARAGIIQYFGIDPGVGPGMARPNSDAQAAAYAAAVSAFQTPTQKVDFEGLPLGQPSTDNTPITVAQSAKYGNVTLSVSGVDHTVVPGFPFGIASTSGDPVNEGYNTTSGGSQFYWFVPSANSTTTIATFSWKVPAQGFGAYLTGLGDAMGSLSLVFNDGAPQSLHITGSPLGGVEFFGFTDFKKQFNSISFVLTGYQPTNKDVFGIDDVLIGYFPEPASAISLALGLCTLAIPFGLRRIRALRGRGRSGAESGD
jgi:hypothetical protein